MLFRSGEERVRGRRSLPVGEVDDGGSGGAPVKFPSSLGALGGCCRGQKREEREGIL